MISVRKCGGNMQICLVKETSRGENRVALVPSSVGMLVATGHELYIQSGAGEGSHFSDTDYQQVGANIVFSAEEAYARGEIVVKVLPPTPEEVEHLTSGCLISFLQIAAGRKKLLDKLIDEKVLAMGLELIVDDQGRNPVVIAMSEIAGQLAVQFAANYLLTNNGGRGLLLGAIPGTSGAVVTILGVGTLGISAARTALGMGAQVVLLDKNLASLRYAQEQLGSVTTMVATPERVQYALSFTDIAIGAVSIAGHRAPHLVNREMVRKMKKGSVIIDTAVDMGGCFETTRPTTIESPTFIAEDVVHCCIPNLPSLVCRSSSRALSFAITPMLQQIAESGSLVKPLIASQGLRSGVVTINGTVTSRDLAEIYDKEHSNLMSQLKKIHQQSNSGEVVL
jgi:alanine dehydrogenase